ncbi:hypothetical protein R6Q59_004422 [Mikania micrantha]
METLDSWVATTHLDKMFSLFIPCWYLYNFFFECCKIWCGWNTELFDSLSRQLTAEFHDVAVKGRKGDPLKEVSLSFTYNRHHLDSMKASLVDFSRRSCKDDFGKKVDRPCQTTKIEPEDVETLAAANMLIPS